MTEQKMHRMNVAVDVSFDYQGCIVPTTIHDEDGEMHWVDHVYSMQPAIYANQSTGARFDIRVGGKDCSLYFEQRTDPSRCAMGRWYLEYPEALPSFPYMISYGA